MSRRLAVVAIWLGLLGVCGLAIYRAPVISDLTHFLPYRSSLTERVLVGQIKHGVASRLILMALEGAEPEALAAASQRLIAELKGNSLFASVHNGSAELSEDDQKFLFDNRYLLSPMTAGAFSVEALRQALTDRLEELASPAGTLEKPVLARDPTGAFLQIMRAWLPHGGPAKRQGVWFTADGRRALLIAETRMGAFDLDGQARAIEALRTTFKRVRGSSSLRLVLAGPPVFSVEANASITREAAWLSILNGIAVTVILWLVYRSFRVLLLGLIPLATGALVGAAAVAAWFGSIHGITLGFGAALIGVAADYPNHLFTHVEPGETPQRSIGRIWPTLRLGVLTNVAGFAAMLFSGFEGLAQLGLFAACGLLGAAAAVRWILPLLMPDRIVLPVRLLGRLQSLPARSPRWSVLPPVSGMAACIWLWWSPMPLWNNDIDALSPVPAASKQLDEELRRDLGAPDLRKLLIVRGASSQDVLERSEALARRLQPLVRQGNLAGYDMASHYLPSAASQLRNQQAIPSSEELPRRLLRALDKLPFRSNAFAPFLQDAASARTMNPLTLDSAVPAIMAMKVRSLLYAEGEDWVGLVPLQGVGDDELLRQSALEEGDGSIDYVDLREETSGMLADYRREALQLLGWSSIAIAILLAFGLRSLGLAVRVLLPMLCAAAATAAIMAERAGGLSLFHLVSLLLVMGLSLDQALFFNKPSEHGEDRARTLLSLLICNCSAVIAFGILALSSINILHAIGATVSVGAAFALAFGAALARKQGTPA